MFYTCKEEMTSLLATGRGMDKASLRTDGIPQDSAGRGFFFLFSFQTFTPYREFSQRNRMEPSPPIPLGDPPVNYPEGIMGKVGIKTPKATGAFSRCVLTLLEVLAHWFFWGQFPAFKNTNPAKIKSNQERVD